MPLSCGIVGLPNVGKSSLANILAKMQVAESANYPFCTIEPNHFMIAVLDERIEQLAEIANSQKIIETQIDIWDIAGLVKGASSGDGLGNKFLSNIREVDAIIHVIRCFENPDVTHVYETVNTVRDKEIVEYELIMADLESIESRIPKLEKKKDEESKKDLDYLKRMKTILESNKMCNTFIPSTSEEEKIIKKLQLLTTKPVIYLCNISEEDSMDEKYKNNLQYQEFIKQIPEQNVIAFPIKSEADLVGLSEDERKEMIESFGLVKDNVKGLINKCYSLLGLQSFFTVGPKEARSWSIKKGSTAPQAAGVIHTDFEKGFIRAETISFDDYIKYKGESGARNSGSLRTEGKDYVVKDGDVIHFLFNN